MSNAAPTLWDKIVAWFSNAEQVVVTEFNKDEQALLALVQPLFGAAEATAIQAMVHFITGALSQSTASKTLPEWETAILNGMQTTGSELLALAESLGSNVLQALIGLVLQRLSTAKPSA